MAEPRALRPIDIVNMTDVELEALRHELGEEQYRRKCRESLSGHQGCDQGNTPHDEHGYDTYGHDGKPLRVTWKKKED
jgi:hypothetical protein